MKHSKKHIGSSFDNHFKRSLSDHTFSEAYAQERIKFEISEMVKKYRRKAGLTQRQLAEITGLKQSAIARIESRTAKMIPSIEILRRIFIPLGLTITYRIQNLKKAT
jgi:DNA-binding XRE family transcriptional regulator